MRAVQQTPGAVLEEAQRPTGDCRSRCIHQVSCQADGLLAAGATDGKVHLLKFPSLSRITTIDCADEVRGVAVTASAGVAILARNRLSLHTGDAASQTLYACSPPCATHFRCLVVLADGSFIAAANAQQRNGTPSLLMHYSSELVELRKMKCGPHPITSVAVSVDQQRACFGTSDGSIGIVDVQAWHLCSTFRDLVGFAVTSVAMSHRKHCVCMQRERKAHHGPDAEARPCGWGAGTVWTSPCVRRPSCVQSAQHLAVEACEHRAVCFGNFCSEECSFYARFNGNQCAGISLDRQYLNCGRFIYLRIHDCLGVCRWRAMGELTWDRCSVSHASQVDQWKSISLLSVLCSFHSCLTRRLMAHCSKTTSALHSSSLQPNCSNPSLLNVHRAKRSTFAFSWFWLRKLNKCMYSSALANRKPSISNALMLMKWFSRKNRITLLNEPCLELHAIL